MKDSIDKQAIFTIVEHRYPDVVDSQYRVGYADAINDVLKDISYMPSAQSEIIRYKDSIVYRKDVVEALYQALRTQLQGTFTDSMSLAISMAQALPSAELENTECKYYCGGYCNQTGEKVL